MAIQSNDLLLVQQGNIPKQATADQISDFVRTQVEPGDIGIASASTLGVIRVGNNLSIDANGILEAVLPAALEYQGVWVSTTTVPPGALNGHFYVWDGGNGQILANTGWGTANGETVNDGDRLIYDGAQWDVVPGGGGGIVSVEGAAPIFIDSTNADHPEVNITAASATEDGYMTSGDWQKLQNIQDGAEENIDPTATFSATNSSGTLTLQPGGDTTAIPGATTSAAGLMSAADKTTLDNLVSSPGGVLSIVAGDNIVVNTTTAPGSAGTPEINVAPNSFIPFDLSSLPQLV